MQIGELIDLLKLRYDQVSVVSRDEIPIEHKHLFSRDDTDVWMLRCDKLGYSTYIEVDPYNIQEIADIYSD